MFNTLLIGKVYLRFDELPSTNDKALEFIAKTRPQEGTVLRADNQTAGRGQFGNTWQSSPGENLLISIILYPEWLEAQRQFYLSMAVALAVRDTLAAFSAEVHLKWPNDILLGDKKTAGILIQNSISGSNLQSSVAGIGLNVNQLTFDDTLPNAGSMAAVLGRSFDTDRVMEQLLMQMEQRYFQLKSGQLSNIRSDYEQALWRLGETALYQRTGDQSVFEGKIRGVNDSGLLKIESAGGLELFDLKQVKFIY